MANTSYKSIIQDVRKLSQILCYWFTVYSGLFALRIVPTSFPYRVSKELYHLFFKTVHFPVQNHSVFNIFKVKTSL